MKIETRPSIVLMEPAILSNLVREVKETLATDITLPAKKQNNFTAADLWNIHRNAVTARSRFNQ